MARDSINLCHRIQLHNPTVLSKNSRYRDSMVREAVEVELHLNIMNREDVLCLSWSWKRLIHSLKGYKKRSS
jgi:hypothetical protein